MGAETERVQLQYRLRPGERMVFVLRFGRMYRLLGPIGACAAGSRAHSIRSGEVGQLDPDPLVDPTLGLVARDADAADLARVGDVGPTVRLEIEPHDLDRPDLLDAGRQEVDLGPDEVRDRE